MIKRPFWINLIEQAWINRPIVWLSGVRRSGKTTLTKMLDKTIYMNCDLPSVERRLKDPESFYDTLPKGTRIVFDEIHRVENPSQLLKIAADEYPGLKVIATGSSTLAATKKFRDTLTGRKTTIYLPPVLWSECIENFQIKDLDHRFLHGGLPEILMSSYKDFDFFSEWIDSFYARDVQELFGIRSRTGFIKLLHLLILQSGGLVDYTHLAKLSELSRPTVKTYIEAMGIANAVFLLPPFHGGGRREITHLPKIFTFDTGFVTFLKGWESIRENDRGILWEHLVLDTLRVINNYRNLYYWRDKSGREIDFIIKKNEQNVNIFECKINPDNLKIDNIIVFRTLYPNGINYIVSPFIKIPFKKRVDNIILYYCSVQYVIENLEKI